MFRFLFGSTWGKRAERFAVPMCAMLLAVSLLASSVRPLVVLAESADDEPSSAAEPSAELVSTDEAEASEGAGGVSFADENAAAESTGSPRLEASENAEDADTSPLSDTPAEGDAIASTTTETC